MLTYKNIGWDVKIPIFAGALAFLLSLFAGLGSGNDGSVVFVRALIFMIVFGGICFGALFTLKKFVPEMFEIIPSKPQVSPEEPESAVIDSTKQPSSEFSGSAETEKESRDLSKVDVYDAPPAFQQASLDKISSSAGGSSISESQKLKEQTLKFQPKIMADAIRTIMSKDNE